VVARCLPLRVEGLEVRRRGRRLLGPVSLAIEGAGSTVVMGPNGSGKTTLLQTLHGLTRPSAGRIQWACDEVAARPLQAFVFQTPVILRRSVLDNIAFPLLLKGESRKVARAAAEEWAARIGLSDAVDQMAPQLSGGEKQKLALARALIRRPEILFLDEPCANLDGRSTGEIEKLLKEASEAGTRIVIATHDFAQARRLAGEVIFLHNGLIIESGPRSQLLEAPESPEARAFIRGELLP
jgi:tungstate transport system ATP-binding protein